MDEQAPQDRDPKEDSMEQVMPFTRQELRGLLRRPHRMLEVVFPLQQRLTANITMEHRLPLLIAGMLLCSVLFALPFGAVLGIAGFWRAALLFVGTLLICFPSLHIFGVFLGSRLTLEQTFCLSLVLTVVSAIFTFGFFPILLFLDLTMTDASQISPQHMAVALLGTSLVFGIIHHVRISSVPGIREKIGSAAGWLILPWQLLFFFIWLRMIRYLGLM